MRIGIVIVTHNSEKAIRHCLESCRQVPGAEIVVVDNQSADYTREAVTEFSGVQLVANESNAGFAAAVNQGVRLLRTDVVLVLNPDTVLLAGTEDLARVMTDAQVGAATGQLLNGDGTRQDGFGVRGFPTPVTLIFEVLGINRLWPANPVNRRYRRPLPNTTIAVDVEQPAGAYLMVRRSAWERLNGFDSSFHPIWFEDVDFCLRLKQAGYRILYVPSARASHAGAHSIRQLDWGRRQIHWYTSLLKYSAKHFSAASLRLVASSVCVASLLRGIHATVTKGTRSAVSVYSRVSWLAGLCLVAGKSAVPGVPRQHSNSFPAEPEAAVVKSSTATTK